MDNNWRSALGVIVTLFLAATSMAHDARYFRVCGPVQPTITAFTMQGYITWTNPPTNATFTVQTAKSVPGPSNWLDYIQVPVSNSTTTHRLFDPNAPQGMVLIPAGSFQMGDALGDGWAPDSPVHTNFVSELYMDKCEISKGLWDEVYQWAITNGYSFTNAGSGKSPTHPVQQVNWYDAVKWCNARSEKEGRTPAYYTGESKTNVFRSGQADLQESWVNWMAGYRLPTEAEWEKAARGGIDGRRYSWANADTITHAQANYTSFTTSSYDVSASRGYHPNFNEGTTPYTSPTVSFEPNGYGLHSAIGNVSEWCWDKYSSSWYSQPSATNSDTHGPAGTVGDNASRLYRGGAWNSDAFNSRVSFRRADDRTFQSWDRGFRTVLPTQP